MRVFVAGVSGEQQYVRGMVALHELILSPGDEVQVRQGERGEVARTMLCTEFLARTDMDAMLLLDLDMDHPRDLLRRLRAHDLDIVSGHYFRRQFPPESPMMSIVSTISDDDTWPYPNLMEVPQDGMMEVANVGMGCVLIKRKTIEAVASLLPIGDSPFATRPMPELSRGYHQKWGSDFGFYALARQLGFKVWVDFGVESKHGTLVWLDRELYEWIRPHNDLGYYYAQLWWQNKELYGMNPKTIEARIEQLANQNLDIMNKGKGIEEQIRALQTQLRALHNEHEANRVRIDECKAWLGKGDGVAQVKKIANLPIFSDEEEAKKAMAVRRGPAGASPEEVREKRERVYGEEAMEHVKLLDARMPQSDGGLPD